MNLALAEKVCWICFNWCVNLWDNHNARLELLITLTHLWQNSLWLQPSLPYSSWWATSASSLFLSSYPPFYSFPLSFLPTLYSPILSSFFPFSLLLSNSLPFLTSISHSYPLPSTPVPSFLGNLAFVHPRLDTGFYLFYYYYFFVVGDLNDKQTLKIEDPSMEFLLSTW